MSLDALLDAPATQGELAGGLGLEQIEEHRGQRPLRQLAGAGLDRCRDLGRCLDRLGRCAAEQTGDVRGHVAQLVGLGKDLGAELLAHGLGRSGIAGRAAHGDEVHAVPAGLGPDGPAQGHAVHAGHAQVGDHHVGPVLAKRPQPLLAVVRGDGMNVEPGKGGVLRQRRVQHRLGVLVVVYDQNRGHGFPITLAAPASILYSAT